MAGESWARSIRAAPSASSKSKTPECGWQLAHLTLNMAGKELMLKSLHVVVDETATDYHSVPPAWNIRTRSTGCCTCRRIDDLRATVTTRSERRPPLHSSKRQTP